MNEYSSIGYGGFSSQLSKMNTMQSWRQQKQRMHKTGSLPNIRKGSHGRRTKRSRRRAESHDESKDLEEEDLQARTVDDQEKPDALEEPSHQLILHTQRKLKNGIFNIRVAANSDSIFIIGDKTDGSENYVIELTPEQMTNIMNEFQQNYEALCDHLEIMQKRMVLLNPAAKSSRGKKRRKGKSRGRKVRNQDDPQTHREQQQQLEDNQNEGAVSDME